MFYLFRIAVLQYAVSSVSKSYDNLQFVKCLTSCSRTNRRGSHQLELIVCCVILLLWPPCLADADIIFLPCGFFFFLFFPRLISAVGDWMSSILAHMVWP